MAYTTLVPTDVLARRVADPALVVIDCRFKLDDVEWGERQFTERHIPGARYAHLDRDLSGPKTGRNGRHPLPDPQALAATLGRLGVDDSAQVVAYDQDNGMYASRLWWLLRWMGHTATAVLDGGFAKWIAEGRAIESGATPPAPARPFHGSPNPDMVVDVSRVGVLAHDPQWSVIDARAPERYRGEFEPLDRVAGHIPGAANHFYQRNLDERGTFRTPDALRDMFRDAAGTNAPKQIVCYCGSGVTACHNLLAMEHAGLTGGRLYPGSWSEWSADPGRAIEKG